MRQFPQGFLRAYQEYADTGFIPPQFNTWCALSVIAGALERRVWLPWDSDYAFYPNIYVMLVSNPGDGKSVALNKAVDLLLEVNRRTVQRLNIMPNQVTEAKFIELMGNGRSFREHVGEKELIHRMNSGYYYASEASNSLKNVFGDFIACLTDFYDCPKHWARATKKDGREIRLENVCMNILAGTTFDYLGKLVSDDNIAGGFASRLIYVVSRNKEVMEQEFQLGRDAAGKEQFRIFREALVEDLTRISEMTGPMHATAEFGAAWKAWYPDYERRRRSIESTKVQSLMARTNPNILKVAMLISSAESSDRELKLSHWEQAHDLVMALQEQTVGIFREAKATSADKRPANLNSTVIHMIESQPDITIESITNNLVIDGFNKQQVQTTLNAMLSSNVITLVEAQAGGRVPKVLGNSNNYL